MDDRVTSPAPRHVIDSLDQSVRDIASGNVQNADVTQAEARRMLADFERAQLTSPTPRPAKSARAR